MVQNPYETEIWKPDFNGNWREKKSIPRSKLYLFIYLLMEAVNSLPLLCKLDLNNFTFKNYTLEEVNLIHQHFNSVL